MDEGIAQKMMTILRKKLAEQALEGNALVINDPELREQFEQLRKRNAAIQDKDAIRQQILRQQDSETTPPGPSVKSLIQPPLRVPTTAPTTPPTTVPTVRP
jgi:hypothetical protein